MPSLYLRGRYPMHVAFCPLAPSLTLLLFFSLSVICHACKNIVVFLQQRNNIHRERRPCKQPESRPMQRRRRRLCFFLHFECENEPPDIKIKTKGNALCIALAILPKGYNKEKNEGNGMSLPHCGKMDVGRCFEVRVRLFSFGFFALKGQKVSKNWDMPALWSLIDVSTTQNSSLQLMSPSILFSVVVHVPSFLPSLFPLPSVTRPASF